MLSTVLLLGLTLVAAVTDLLRHKIYNWNTYSGILAALGPERRRLVRCWPTGRGAKQRLEIGSAGSRCWRACSGLLLCGGLMVVCFVLFRHRRRRRETDGHDRARLLGMEKGLEAMLWTFVLGACFSLIVLVWRVGPVRLIGGVVRQWSGRCGWAIGLPLSDEERAELKPPLFLAPSALAAVVIVRFGLMRC